ncbi:MAG: DUF433 domain-containing protein [Methanohalophilus sp.]
MVLSDKIIINNDICAGKLVIKGTRISVDFVIELLENNWSYDDILENYPQLEREDILAALRCVS